MNRPELGRVARRSTVCSEEQQRWGELIGVFMTGGALVIGLVDALAEC